MNYELFLVAAAIRNPDNILEIRVGHRHHIILNNATPLGACAQWEQGFLASDGQFYSREDACTIALAAKQIDYVIEPLCSEDLWPFRSWIALRCDLPTDSESVAEVKAMLRAGKDKVKEHILAFQATPFLLKAYKKYKDSLEESK